MEKAKVIFNPRPLDRVLLFRLVELKRELNIKEGGCISYKKVREKIGRNFSINESVLKEILSSLNSAGLIEFGKRGIKLLFDFEDEK